MKSYKDYALEDFLEDEDFQQWVRAGSPAGMTVWQRLVDSFPEKRVDLEEAREFILSWQHQSSFSDADVERGIQRVLSTKRAQQRPVVRWFNSRATSWQIAAATILLVGIGWSVWQSSQANQPYTYTALTAQSPVALKEVINTHPVNQRINLPDGSQITLAPTSRISYSTRMKTEPLRKVFLTGEAFFEVIKNPKQPFLVYADGLITRVVGTSFTIRTGRKQVSVIVRSGRVAVYPMQETKQPDGSEKTVMLTPNQQATFLPENNQLTPSIVDKPLSLQAEAQPVSFDFESTPVAEVFARLEQAYGLSIQYDKAVMKNCQLTVPLRDEPFFTKLNIICQTLGASYSVDGTKIIISSEGCN